LNDFSEKVGEKLTLKVDPIAMEVTKERQLAESVPSDRLALESFIVRKWRHERDGRFQDFFAN
jgi:hypothetical protein